MIRIELGRRYAAAFGLLGSNNLPGSALVWKGNKRYNLESFDAPNTEFENVKFKYDGKEVAFAALPFKGKDTDGVLGNVLAPPPLVSFSRQKAHIETPVNDSDNVVVERWGTKPWQIRIRGLLIDMDERNYPEQRITALYKLFRYNGVVEVSGTQFFDKDIFSLFFTDVEITSVQGFSDTVQFSLQAKSTMPVEFTLLNGQ